MSKHLVSILIVLPLVALGPGCAFPKDQPKAPAVAPLPAGSFAKSWFNALRLGKDQVRDLHLRGDTVYVYTEANHVYAVSRGGGDLKYMATPAISGGTLRPPLILGENIIYPSGSTIEVFNTRGRPIKTIELEKPTRSGAIGDGVTIFIGLDHEGGRGVLASINLDRAYRYLNWEMLAFGAVSPTPAMFEKIIFAGAEDGKLYAITEERAPVWSLPGTGSTFNTLGKFTSDIKADEYGVYAANTDSKLYCLDRATGKVKWQYYSGVPLQTSPIVFAANVYQYVSGVGIVCIDKANGQFNRQPKWAVKDGRQVLSEDQGHVYLKGRDGRILAVDKATGQVQFRSKGKWDLFSTNMTDATIFASTKDGKITGINPVLREGEVGTIVMDFREAPLALAR